jgi:hypothetical protein
MHGREGYRSLVIRIPLAMLPAVGIHESRIDVAVGAMGTPDEGLLRIAAGKTYTLYSNRRDGYRPRSAFVRIAVSRGLPLVRITPVKVREQQGALVIVMPQQLRAHYEDLARKAASVAENNAAPKVLGRVP